MRHPTLILLICATCVAFVSCTGEEEPVFEAFTVNDISGEALWNRITEDFHYSGYAFWPGHEGVRAGQAPHGTNHRIYVNRTLLDALPAPSGIAPNGSVIVKDSLNASGELVSVTVMAKVKGYNPEAGDWFWVFFQPDGSVRVEGTPKGCIGCHEGLKENDYVIVQQLDLPLRN